MIAALLTDRDVLETNIGQLNIIPTDPSTHQVSQPIFPARVLDWDIPQVEANNTNHRHQPVSF
jgi:hypothetical protein